MLDDQTADRILSGLVAPADAPPGYAEVTRLVLALRDLAGRALPDAPAANPAVRAPSGVPRTAYLAAAVTGAGLALAAVRIFATRLG